MPRRCLKPRLLMMAAISWTALGPVAGGAPAGAEVINEVARKMPAQSHDLPPELKAIEQLASEMEAAWNAGDAHRFAQFFQEDGTFTNVNGSSFKGKAAFEQRHQDIFSGSLKGSKGLMALRELRYVRGDVAIADFDCSVTVQGHPPLETRLQMVLTKEAAGWTIAAYHNTAVAPQPLVK